MSAIFQLKQDIYQNMTDVVDAELTRNELTVVLSALDLCACDYSGPDKHMVDKCTQVYGKIARAL